MSCFLLMIQKNKKNHFLIDESYYCGTRFYQKLFTMACVMKNDQK